jgi:catechol 2,3-dioxygenase-like lactoylglutathione lyase family enzyme
MTNTDSIPELDAIGLIVADMAKSLALYRRLGLDIAEGAEDQPHVEATLRGGLRLTWDTADEIRSFDPDYEAQAGGPRVGLAFKLDSPAAVDAMYERLVAAGYEGHKAPWDAFWGQRYALIHDPDGNSVDLFAPLPAAESS